ncbi:hypothetical protein L211DRAFT_890339 [Terfezia boudieri ATCC MYA-4762]|uniref:Uncharacterized protein n=1 Tax=Terfezia boudieri ATCC MYA-4762 TaxID=1051890 RepID=A0A3N4LE10_9PEZI|nr:hypothetical protein L211DRAFT_890339 [Terfezia boudieri ATCC MYA-4762]
MYQDIEGVIGVGDNIRRDEYKGLKKAIVEGMFIFRGTSLYLGQEGTKVEIRVPYEMTEKLENGKKIRTEREATADCQGMHYARPPNRAQAFPEMLTYHTQRRNTTSISGAFPSVAPRHKGPQAPTPPASQVRSQALLHDTGPQAPTPPASQLSEFYLPSGIYISTHFSSGFEFSKLYDILQFSDRSVSSYGHAYSCSSSTNATTNTRKIISQLPTPNSIARTYLTASTVDQHPPL